MVKNKKAVTPVVATILLILITIAAILLIANFLIPWTKDKLGGTGCIRAINMIEIVSDSSYTCYDSNDKEARVMIEMGDGDVEIGGIIISLTGEGKSKIYKIRNETSLENAKMYGDSDDFGVSILEIPNKGEIRTFVFDKTALDFIPETAECGIMLATEKICETVSTELKECV